jgi:hypothetical protein
MHQLGLTRRPPKMGGIYKFLIALNLKAFEHALTHWVGALLSRPIAAQPSPQEAYALDGKSAGGSFNGLQKARIYSRCWPMNQVFYDPRKSSPGHGFFFLALSYSPEADGDHSSTIRGSLKGHRRVTEFLF